MKKIAFMGAILFFAQWTLANAIVCESGSDQRKLEITEVEKGCKLEYTKDGETKELATQKNGRDHCEEVQSRIKDKLEKSQFKCS